MDKPELIKETVKNKYSEIASSAKGSGCCGPVPDCCGSNSNIEFTMIGDDYKSVDGYVPDADLGLGCGLPTEYAGIKHGDVVVDLGSGAGNDVFIASNLVGKSGKVIGVDMTEAMIEKANENKMKLGYENVEFRLGDIENLPIEDQSVDVVISNCVLNLVPDKRKAFSEIFRILKTGAHFCVSDVVVQGHLPEELKHSAEFYAGCVAGALSLNEYIELIRQSGFQNIEIKKSRRIELPEEMLEQFLSSKAIEDYKNSVKGIYSITVVAHKL